METRTILLFSMTALALAIVPILPAQTPTNPTSGQTTESKAADVNSMTVSICYEAFSLPITKAGGLQRKGLTDEELYKELISLGKLERLLVLRTKSGDRAVLENVSEHRFPTEFTPPQIPTPNPNPPRTVLPLSPTAFEKKDIGDSLDGKPTLSPDGKSVDVQIEVSHVELARREKWGRGITEIEQPQYETQKLVANFTASVGSPCLIGTLNPVFGNGVSTRSEQNVWLCFITTTLVHDNATVPVKTRQ